MNRRAPPRNRLVIGLLLFYVAFSATIDLYWVVHAQHLPELAAAGDWIARLYGNFATTDHGYYDRVGQAELGLEAVNVTVTQAMNLVLLVALWRRWPMRVPLQMAIGAIVAYSVLFDYACAALAGFPNMDTHDAGSLASFFGASAPWLLGHLYFVWDGWRQAARALRTPAPRRRPGAPVPSFETARNLRQQARAAGLDPDHWYAATQARNIGPLGIHETQFQGAPIVIFRNEQGVLHALENRCRHRGVRLSLGEVSCCTIVCPYHGWAYDGAGRLTHVEHETHGQDLSRVRVRSYPLRERYGLVWIFPGDPALATVTAIPDIPEIEGRAPWAYVPLEFTWNAHHTMIIDNLSDLTHGYLHRHYQPFKDPVLVRHELRGDSVYCLYNLTLMQNPVIKRLLDRSGADMDTMELCFEYPYQWGNTGNRVKHWVFLMPLDERTTKVFFVFYFNEVQLPFTRYHIPQRLMGWVIRASNRFFIRPLVSQDGEAVEWEQEGYEAHSGRPLIELNPSVSLFQQVTVRRWRAHLARRAARQAAAE